MPRYTIEICGPRNENAIFPPLPGERLRGRWDMAKVSHRNKSSEEAGECFKSLAMAVSVIPGQFISVDTEAGIGQVVDPLGASPEGQKILAIIKGVLSRFTPGILDCGAESRPTTNVRLSIDDVKTWLFYMRTMLDTEIAVAVSGASPLPDIETIRKMPGRRRRDPGNTGEQTARSQTDADATGKLYKWADEVPVGAELVGAGAASERNEQPPAGNKGKQDKS